jgi:hypothetical protein
LQETSMNKRPVPLCPMGKHELICHCGEPADHYYDNHSAVTQGCCICYADYDELRSQQLEEREFEEVAQEFKNNLRDFLK